MSKPPMARLLAVASTCVGATDRLRGPPAPRHSRPGAARAASDAAAARFPATIPAANGTSTIAGAAHMPSCRLSPTATEMLYAIGAGSQVKAVDKYSDYPTEGPPDQPRRRRPQRRGDRRRTTPTSSWCPATPPGSTGRLASSAIPVLSDAGRHHPRPRPTSSSTSSGRPPVTCPRRRPRSTRIKVAHRPDRAPAVPKPAGRSPTTTSSSRRTTRSPPPPSSGRCSGCSG